MATSKQSVFQLGELDRITIWLYAALVFIGWGMIFSVNYDPEADTFGFLDLDNNAGKQMFFIIICLALMFFIFMTDWAIWRTYALIIYIITLIILPGTLIFGREINGAYAWYQLGGFSFQPSELAKFGTSLALAGYLSSTGVNLNEWRSRFIAIGIFMLPAAIILAQSDTGSALVFFSFALALYREGLAPSWYVLGFGTACCAILGLATNPPYTIAVFFMILNFYLISRFRENNRPWWIALVLTLLLTIWWPTVSGWFFTAYGLIPEQVPNHELLVLVPHILLLIAAFLPNYLRKNALIQNSLRTKLLLLLLASGIVFGSNFANNKILAPYQQQRIKLWLNPSEAAADARGSAYNLLHSKMAIGSGGFWGKGTLKGNMTRLNYVPEQTTDFIFCTVGEEQGFLGALLVIALFAALLVRITVLAERQRSNFSRIYAYCVAGIVFVHFIVNIGMTMGLFPIIGIPLPFLSYGGSSLIGFTLMIGVLLKLDSNRNLA
mgnify:CR=1 FL=1